MSIHTSVSVFLQRVCKTIGLAVAMAGGLAVLAPAAANAHEIVITISSVSALDRGDALSRPDFLARVTIAGETFTTAPIMNQADIKPNWVFTKSVAPGRHDVKIEILDKDVTKDDPVDINRIDNKRDLDFTVDSRRCRIDGFKPGYRCGQTIVRAGLERRRAEIAFTVDVKR